MKTNTGKKRLVLLDAHAIIHRAYHALPEFSTSQGEPTGGLYGLSTMLIKLLGELKPDYIVAAYDLPGPTLRHAVYDGYKAQRKKVDEALVSQLNRSRDIFTAFNIPMYDHPGFEADDILGTIVEKEKKDPPLEIIIATGDMDTLQLVSGTAVRVFTLRKGITDTVMYDEAKVIERFGFGPALVADYKGLRGDPSDNIVGVPGIGDKTATELITKFGSIEDIYRKLKKHKAAFAAAGIKPRVVELLAAHEEEALFSKMLATIRTDAPISFVLPQKTWREAVDITRVKELFTSLEFRTLGARAELLLGTPAASAPAVATDDASQKPLPSEAPALSPQEKTDLAVLLWLTDSTKTDATLEEVYEITKTTDPARAKEVLLEELRKKDLLKIYETIEKPLLPVVDAMNARGIAVDRAHFEKLGKEYHAELEKLETKIFAAAGVTFNVASPKQLGEILFEKLGLKAKNQKKTPTGGLSTKESELEKMRESHPIVSLVLEHRELAKLLGTYIDPLPALLDPAGRLHTTFLQAGTTTGRMASRNPNLQNIPNKTDVGRKIREGFIASPGYTLLALDYSQMELRIAAFLSGDEKLIEIFKRGHDVHASVASHVFGVPVGEVTAEMRRRAKVINFGVMYGMGVNALRVNLRTDRAEAQKFYDDYFSTFSGLAHYLDQVRAETARRGYTETYFGRRRYFEGLRSKIPYIRASAERMAINAPIQGTGADIIKLAMVRADAFRQRQKAADDIFLLLQVHDELVYEVKTPRLEHAAPALKKIMEEVLPLSETKDVPIRVEGKVGATWGTMTPLRS